MLKILFGVICAFASGVLLAVPIGLVMDAKWSPFLGAPVALIMLAGLVITSIFLFAPPN